MDGRDDRRMYANADNNQWEDGSRDSEYERDERRRVQNEQDDYNRAVAASLDFDNNSLIRTESEREQTEQYQDELAKLCSKELKDLKIRHGIIAERERDALEARLHGIEQEQLRGLERFQKNRHDQGLRNMQDDFAGIRRAMGGYDGDMSRVQPGRAAVDRIHGGAAMGHAHSGRGAAMGHAHSGRAATAHHSGRAAVDHAHSGGAAMVGHAHSSRNHTHVGNNERSESLRAAERRSFVERTRVMGFDQRIAAARVERRRLERLGDTNHSHISYDMPGR